MMRQIAGSFAEYEKARLVAKLRSAAAGQRLEAAIGANSNGPTAKLIRQAQAECRCLITSG
jgi:hypothetical protein